MAMTTAADPKTVVREAIKNLTTLATLPEITAQIITAVEDPRSSAGRLHKIVAHDPALVTRILKIVNSAFYGLPGQIGSVERAIVLLGLNAIKNVAVAASLGQLFRGANLCEGKSVRDLWTHCIAVGVASRELAKLMRLPFPDEAFLAGMIHDTGILVELQTWPERTRKVCADVLQNGGDFCEAERQALGVDHQMMGEALAEKWKFPMSCQHVAGHHHNPAGLGDDARVIVSVVHTADVLCCRGGHGFCLTALHDELDLAALAEVGITQIMIDTITANLPKLVSDAVVLLG
ncbi:MAG: HDOD domain-containing protein [Planctomycetota bacterium]|nr:HDOD domain-containing protein [Planctomycetota bacterium]